VCEVLRDESLEVALRGEAVALAAPAGRAPYELVLAPRQHTAELSERDLVHAAQLLRDSIRRLRAVEGPVPLNAWLHTGGHWHFELVPRLTVFAGLELGAGIYVNSLPPEEAAQRLRA
jgi:UDPglucose--hexose-1-phosphate uridylyltransferase